LKKVLVSCLKGGVLVFVILSSGLALYIHYEGEDCDPVSEIQRLKQENRRDEALDMARFFGKNQRSNKEKIKELEERLEYTTFEKGKSFTWNGVIKGEVHDSYSGIGAKAGFDPGKCQKEIFAPLPAISLEGLPAVLLAGLLTKLSRV